MRPAAPRGALPGVGACAPGCFGAGIEPATIDVTGRCSNQIELSKATCRIRTGGPWHPKPMLYPTELTSFAKHRTCRPGIRCRQSRAHRMGLEPTPLGPVGSMFLIAGCCQPAIGVGFQAQSVGIRFCTARAEAPGRSALAPVAAAPLFRLQATGCFRAKRIPQTSFDTWVSLANAKNKTPPGLATRGRSRYLGRSG